MSKPWENVELSDYETHMQLSNVYQLQTLNKIMHDQFYDYPVKTITILGIAGGNGLEHIDPEKFSQVTGIDINTHYLEICRQRYPKLSDVMTLIRCDLTDETSVIPESELIIANLLIEYIGLDNFQKKLAHHPVKYVSCVIQKNPEALFVSFSPLQDKFTEVAKSHTDVDEISLINTLNDIGLTVIHREQIDLPNKKQFIRVDFQRI